MILSLAGTVKKARCLQRLVLFSALLLLAPSCSRTPTGPDDQAPLISRANLASIRIAFTNYDTVRVTHAEGTSVRTEIVASVSVGIKDTSGFRPVATTSAVSSAGSPTNSLAFDLLVPFERTALQSPLTVRYLLADSSTVDIDTTVNLITYPYQTAEVYLSNDVWFCCYQDLDWIGDLLYFHPTSSYGLFSHDRASGQTTELVTYDGGDAIAADSPYVFIDYGHRWIWRYDISTNAVDLQFPQEFVENLGGLETLDGELYVLLWNVPKLLKYSYDGVPIDTIPYPRSTFFLTIHDSICYSLRWEGGNDLLTRFDLRTRQFLPDLPAPSDNGEGIRIRDGYLYYCSFAKRFIGRIPLSDLLSHGSAVTPSPRSGLKATTKPQRRPEWGWE